MEPIYLDHAATTPLHPQVLEAMLPYLQQEHGNPSSLHRFGRNTKSALDRARSQIADCFHVTPREIIFTSGGTEADNYAVIGAAMANRDKGRHVITSSIEHHAVLDACAYLEQIGFEVTYLPVDQTGRVEVKELEKSLRDDTILVSIMYGNNEVGTLQPIREIGELLREREVLFHSDAVQAFGSLPLDLRELPVDLLSVSSHKINGPKGVGALYVRSNVHIQPLLWGGNQERKKRAGTENVYGIVGFGDAARLAVSQVEEKRVLYEQLRSTMIGVWQEEGIDYTINGHPEWHLPHILNVSFPGTDTETLLMNLDLEGVAVSSGSACTSGSLQRSHVLKAMQLDPDVIRSAIRFSFGYGNTVEQVGEAARITARVVTRLLRK